MLRRRREREEEERPVLLCLRIPDDDEQNEIRKEKTATKRGGKRKRTQHECDVCEKVFVLHPSWPDTCVFTRTRNRTNVMCARSVLVNLVV